jgi:hypothetical protein
MTPAIASNAAAAAPISQVDPEGGGVRAGMTGLISGTSSVNLGFG